MTAQPHDCLTVTAAGPHGGSHGGCPTGEPTRRDIGPVAGRDVGTQAEDAGRSGTRQQDGTHRLGAEHEKGNLPVLRCRLTWRRKRRKERTKSREAVGRCGQDAGTGKGKRSERRDRENQDVHEGHRARVFDWIRSHEHHTGPRPRAPHQEAGHTTVPDLNATDLSSTPSLPVTGRPLHRNPPLRWALRRFRISLAALRLCAGRRSGDADPAVEAVAGSDPGFRCPVRGSDRAPMVAPAHSANSGLT